jgi:hypothetical protein
MVYRVADEMRAYVDMFHSRVCLWIVSASYGALVITVEGRWTKLSEADFIKERAQPDYLLRAVWAGQVFGLTGRQGNDHLLLGTPGKWAVSAFD